MNNTSPGSAHLPDIVIKNYFSPHPEGQFDWSTLNLDVLPSEAEEKKARRKLKMLFPILSLGALKKYVFAGESIDASGTTYAQFYDSLLVLGGSNHLSDGMAEFLNEAGLDIVSARSASLIIMLVPAESRAIYNDITLDMKKLSFAEVLNHAAFKSASNQANHIVTELALPYVRERIDTRKYPGLDKMLAIAGASAAMAAPPILIQVVWGLMNGGDVSVGKMAIDSGVGFMYSTAVTSFKGVNQRAAHVYLDGAKDAQWCDPDQKDCEKVDNDEVYSELLASAFCYLGAGAVDLAASMIPAPAPVTKGMGKWVVSAGLKVVPKLMKTTSKHLRKVTAYAGSDAFNKKMKHKLAPHTSEAEAGSSLITLITNAGVSYVSSLHEHGAPYQTGFGLKSVNAAYNLGAIIAVKLFYSFGLNHAFGFSEPLDQPRDYYSRLSGASLIYPNVEDDIYGYKTIQIVHPQELEGIPR